MSFVSRGPAAAGARLTGTSKWIPTHARNLVTLDESRDLCVSRCLADEARRTVAARADGGAAASTWAAASGALKTRPMSDAVAPPEHERGIARFLAPRGGASSAGGVAQNIAGQGLTIASLLRRGAAAVSGAGTPLTDSSPCVLGLQNARRRVMSLAGWAAAVQVRRAYFLYCARACVPCARRGGGPLVATHLIPRSCLLTLRTGGARSRDRNTAFRCGHGCPD